MLGSPLGRCATSRLFFHMVVHPLLSLLPAVPPAGLSRFILYPGTKHGFAVRGNKQDPAVNKAREDALKQGIRFFGEHLTGTAATAAPVAASVGVLLETNKTR